MCDWCLEQKEKQQAMWSELNILYVEEELVNIPVQNTEQINIESNTK